MPDPQGRWPEVGRRVAERIQELSLTKAEVERRSGISDKTLTAYMGGAPIKRADKARGLCEALEWTVDSISRILDGDEPRRVRPSAVKVGAAGEADEDLAAAWVRFAGGDEVPEDLVASADALFHDPGTSVVMTQAALAALARRIEEVAERAEGLLEAGLLIQRDEEAERRGRTSPANIATAAKARAAVIGPEAAGP